MKIRIMDGKHSIYDDEEWEMLSMCQDTFKREREEFVEKGELQYSDAVDYFSKQGIMQEIEDTKEKYSKDQLNIYSSRKKSYEEFIPSFAKGRTEEEKTIKTCFDFFSDNDLKQLNITKDELIELFKNRYYQSCKSAFLKGVNFINRDGVEVAYGLVGITRRALVDTMRLAESKNANDKTIMASIDGKGGKLSKEDSQIKTIKKDETCTYNIVPEEGYKLYSVMLNGKNVLDRIDNGKLTLSYEELTRNNEVDIKFITNEAAQRFEENNIVEPVKVVVSTDNTSSKYTFVEGEVYAKGLTPGAIALIIIIAAVIVMVVVVMISAFFVYKRKSTDKR